MPHSTHVHKTQRTEPTRDTINPVRQGIDLAAAWTLGGAALGAAFSYAGGGNPGSQNVWIGVTVFGSASSLICLGREYYMTRMGFCGEYNDEARVLKHLTAAGTAAILAASLITSTVHELRSIPDETADIFAPQPQRSTPYHPVAKPHVAYTPLNTAPV